MILTRIFHTPVVQLGKIMVAKGFCRLRRIHCDPVREAKVVGGQKIMKMGRRSVKFPG